MRIANREDPDQTASQKQSDLGLHFLSRPGPLFTVYSINKQTVDSHWSIQVWTRLNSFQCGQGLFSRQLLFKILVQLPYSIAWLQLLDVNQ